MFAAIMFLRDCANSLHRWSSSPSSTEGHVRTFLVHSTTKRPVHPARGYVLSIHSATKASQFEKVVLLYTNTHARSRQIPAQGDGNSIAALVFNLIATETMS
jgi:hypothetical protein